METIVPPVTTPGLTPGTDNGGVGGSLDVSGSGLEGLKRESPSMCRFRAAWTDWLHR